MIAINFSSSANESLFSLKNEDIIVDFRIASNRVKVFLTVLLGIIMILSVIGNLATCVVIVHDRTMRTPTNFYLLNLAITDLLTTLYIPVTLRMIWKPLKYPLGELGCRMQYGLWDIVSCSSVLTIVAFTIERYLVVSKPFLRQKLASNSRVYKIIAMIWLISVLYSIPDVVLAKYISKNEYAHCSLLINYGFKIMQPLGNFLFFVIPMTIISVLYIMIAIKLKAAQTKLRSDSVLQNQNADKAIKMLVAIAAFFFVCWAPYSIMRLTFLTSKNFIIKYYHIWKIMCCVCSINICMSTAVNPILYGLMSRKFRKAFKDILKRRNSSRSEQNVTLQRTTMIL